MAEIRRINKRVARRFNLSPIKPSTRKMGRIGLNQRNSMMRGRNAAIRSGSMEGDIVPPSSDPETGGCEDSEGGNDDEDDEEEADSASNNSSEHSSPKNGISAGVTATRLNDSTHHGHFLLEYLEGIGKGSFAASGMLSDVNPGLSVEGLGNIGLPLSERDAKELAHVSHQAPFGKGSETFVDTSVRKTWEVNGANVRFRNPRWQSTVNSAVSKVIEELGIVGGSASVKAQLHKLLLYESGAFFETHRDTEKAPGMIATMVIALPSQHSGGEVALSLNNQKMILQTQDAGEFGTKYLAWYADVNHAVKPVVSGYRLVLTYNLIRDGPGAAIPHGLPPSVQFDPVGNLELALPDWMLTNEHHFVYMLEHKYSEANFGLNSLKGKDQLRIRYLTDAAKKADICVYFAHFEYSISGGCEDDDPYDHYGGVDTHELIDAEDPVWQLMTVFTTEGDKIASNIVIDEEDFIQNLSLEDQPPDDEDFEGWTGNEGAYATHYYRRSCVVVFPRNQRRALLKDAESIVLDKWAKVVLDEVESLSDTNGDPAVADLVEISALASGPKYSQSAFTNPKIFVDLALRLKEPALLKTAAGKGLEIGTFQKLGSSSLDFQDPQWFEAIQHAFSKTVPGRKRLEAIDSFITATRDSHPDSSNLGEVSALHYTIMQSLSKMWNYTQDESRDDAQALVSICKTFPGNFVHEVLSPLSKRTTNVTFLESLTRGVIGELQRNAMDWGDAKKICDECFIILVSKLRRNCPHTNPDWRDSEQLKEGDDSAKLYWEASYKSSFALTKHLVDRQDYSKIISAKTLLIIINTCEALKLDAAADKLMDFLSDIGRKPVKDIFDTWLFPFLEQIPQSSIESEIARYQRLSQTIINSYIKHFVPPKAARIRDWSNPRRGCRADCMDCRDLDSFLLNINQSSVGFRIAIPRRNHLEQQLRSSNCRISTDKLRGSPHILIVTKTQSIERDDVETLQRLRGDALAAIRKIGDERLRLMLGDRYHTILTPVGMPLIPPYESARPPLASVPLASTDMQGNKRGFNDAFGNTDDDSKPAKKKPEIVDLESDD